MPSTQIASWRWANATPTLNIALAHCQFLPLGQHHLAHRPIVQPTGWPDVGPTLDCWESDIGPTLAPRMMFCPILTQRWPNVGISFMTLPQHWSNIKPTWWFNVGPMFNWWFIYVLTAGPLLAFCWKSYSYTCQHFFLSQKHPVDNKKRQINTYWINKWKFKK